MNLFNLIKRTIVSRKTEDIGQFPVSQVQWNGKTANLESISPYGLDSNLPIDTLVLTFSVLGQEENKSGIGYSSKNRFKNLKEGEVAVGNPVTKSVVKFLENGDIEITCQNDQNVSIVGDSNLTVGGNVNLTVTGNVTSTIAGTLTADVTGNTTLTSPITTIDGVLNVTGEITAFSTGTPIAMSDIKSTYQTHTHNENDAAPAPTAVPNQLIP